MTTKSHLIHELLQQVKTPRDFFKTLSHAKYDKAYEGIDINDVLIELNNNHYIDFIVLLKQQLDQKHNDFGSNCYLLKGAFPEFKLNSEAIVELLKKYHDKSIELQSSIPLIEIAKAQPSVGREILERLLLIDDEWRNPYASDLYIGLSELNFLNVYQELVTIDNTIVSTSLKLAIETITRLNYDNHKDKVSLTINFLTLCLELKDPSINYHLMRSFGRIILLSEQVKLLISKLDLTINPESKTQLAGILLNLSKAKIIDDWFLEKLFSLSNLPSNKNEGLGVVDLVLNTMLSTENCADHTIEYISKWLNESNYIPNKSDITEIFHCSITTLINKHDEVLSRWLTNLILADNSKSLSCANDILCFISHYKKDKEVLLHNDTIAKLSEANIIFLCRKILGRFYNEQQIFSLLFSIFAALPDNHPSLISVIEVFDSVLIYDYRDLARDFLQSQSENTVLSDVKNTALEKAISNMSNYLDQLNSLPSLKEFSPSTINWSLLQVAKHEQERKIREEAHQQSIMSKLAQTVPMKYGQASFSYFGENYSEPTKLGKIQTKHVIAVSNSLSPVSATMRRWKYLTDKKS